MSGMPTPTPADDTLGHDMLIGAKAIGRFLYGTDGRSRSIFHLAAKSRMPHFRVGSRICARRSVLLQWIKDQEDPDKKKK